MGPRGEPCKNEIYTAAGISGAPQPQEATLKFSACVQEGWAGAWNHFPSTSTCTCLHMVSLHPHRVREAFTRMQKERAVCTHHYCHSSSFSPRPEKSNSYNFWEHQSHPEPKRFTEVLLPRALDSLAVARQLKPRPSHL